MEEEGKERFGRYYSNLLPIFGKESDPFLPFLFQLSRDFHLKHLHCESAVCTFARKRFINPYSHEFSRLPEYRFLFTVEQIPSRISKSTNFPPSNRPRYTFLDNNAPTIPPRLSATIYLPRRWPWTKPDVRYLIADTTAKLCNSSNVFDQIHRSTLRFKITKQFQFFLAPMNGRPL